MAVNVVDVGSLQGQSVKKVVLGDPHGSHIALCSYGATLWDWVAPLGAGEFSSIILGYPTFEGLVADTSYLGCTVGRVANRIGGARYHDLQNEVILEANEKNNILHGGKAGLHTKNWQVVASNHEVCFSTVSPDGESGFPGEFRASVTYAFDDSPAQQRLSISYKAECTKYCPVSLTNHAYFNLSSEPTIAGHTLSVESDFYTPTNELSIPTGEILATKHLGIDLKKGENLGEILSKLPDGLDHNFILNKSSGVVAILSSSSTNRVLKVHTTEPGLQVYMGGFLGPAVITKRGAENRFGALCLESQGYPDFVNRNHFKGTFLKPGSVYESNTSFEISMP